MFTSNDDFNILNELLGSNNDLFQQDVTTLRGKNVVLDFIAQIDFEIRLFGWSKTASKIAEFYDTCGGYCIFMSNPVVKMILNETEYNSTVKKYLYQRIFQYIEQDKIKDLDRIFNNNERLTNDIKAKEDKHIEFQEKVNHKVKECGISREVAENQVKLEEYKEQVKIQDISSNAILDSILNWALTPSDIGQQKSIKKNKTKE